MNSTARIASIALMVWAASLSACTAEDPSLNEVQREAAERQALINAMEQHPALQNDQATEATGEPIDVPTTVPPKPAGSGAHENHADPQHPHRN